MAHNSTVYIGTNDLQLAVGAIMGAGLVYFLVLPAQSAAIAGAALDGDCRILETQPFRFPLSLGYSSIATAARSEQRL